MVKKYDDMAWHIIKTRKLHPDDTFPPNNYLEVEEHLRAGEPFEDTVFPHLLDHFYRTRNPKTFEFEPSTFFSPQRRAFLAGVAEYLTRDYGFQVPYWVEKPEFFLSEPWDPLDEFWEELGTTSPIDMAERIADATHEFIRRNVVFKARGLIRL